MATSATAPQPAHEGDLGDDDAASRAMAADAAHLAPLAWNSLRRQTPKVGAECANCASSDLCGGQAETPVPTAIPLHRIEDLLSFEGVPVVRRMLAKFVNVIVFMNHDEATGKRWVSEVVEVQGIDAKGDYVFAAR